MKKTAGIIAGMAAMAMALAFASCGKASVVSDEVRVNGSAAVNTADKTDPDAAVKNVIYKQLAAAQNGDRDAYVEAMNKQLMSDAVESFYGQAISDDDWNDLVSESWDDIADEMRHINGDYTIDEFTLEDDLAEKFDNGSSTCFSFTIDDGSYQVNFVGSAIELDGKVTAYLNLGADDGMATTPEEVQLANSKTLWNAAAQLCYEVGFEDGEYSFSIDEPGDSELGQKIHEMFGDDFYGYGYVKVVNGQPECAKWTENEGDEGAAYAPEMTEDNE